MENQPSTRIERGKSRSGRSGPPSAASPDASALAFGQSPRLRRGRLAEVRRESDAQV